MYLNITFVALNITALFEWAKLGTTLAIVSSTSLN